MPIVTATTSRLSSSIHSLSDALRQSRRNGAWRLGTCFRLSLSLEDINPSHDKAGFPGKDSHHGYEVQAEPFGRVH